MFLQKAIISLALSSVVTPGVIQATNLVHKTIKNNDINLTLAQAKPIGHLEPFNADAYVHSTLYNGDYYAFYKNDAFASLHGGSTYGYILQMSYGSMSYLMTAYNWATSHGKSGPGGMINYLTGGGPVTTPYSGAWDLYSNFNKDAHGSATTVISSSFTYTTEDIFNFVTSAIDNGQTVDFFCYAEAAPTGWVYGKVMIANAETNKTLTTDWWRY